MIKGPTHIVDTAIINIYAPKNRTPKSMKQKQMELSWEIDNWTIIVGDFSTSLSIMDRKARQIKKKKEMTETTLQTN